MARIGVYFFRSMPQLKRFSRRFYVQEDAAIAVTLSLACVPLIVFILLLFEFARYGIAETRVKSACELAVQAAARVNDTVGASYFNSNMLGEGMAGPFKLAFSQPKNSQQKQLTVTGAMPGFFLNLIGQSRLALNVVCVADMHKINNNTKAPFSLSSHHGGHSHKK